MYSELPGRWSDALSPNSMSTEGMVKRRSGQVHGRLHWRISLPQRLSGLPPDSLQEHCGTPVASHRLHVPVGIHIGHTHIKRPCCCGGIPVERNMAVALALLATSCPGYYPTAHHHFPIISTSAGCQKFILRIFAMARVTLFSAVTSANVILPEQPRPRLRPRDSSPRPWAYHPDGTGSSPKNRLFVPCPAHADRDIFPAGCIRTVKGRQNRS